MKLYFGVAGQDDLDLLIECGVDSFAIDATAWRGEGLPSDDTLVYCSSEDTEEIYLEHVAILGPAGGLWVVPSWAEPMDGIECAAVWDGEVMDDAVTLSESFGGVVVAPEALKDLSRLPLVRRSVHGQLGTVSSSLRALKAVSWDFAVVHSWKNPGRVGETQVWDGRGMHRYNASRQRDVRKQHRKHIEALGLDVDRVIENDLHEATKLAVVSWQAYERSTTAAVVATGASRALAPSEDPGGDGLGIADPRGRHERPRVTIPTMGLTLSQAGEDDLGQEELHVRATSNVLRSCDSCFVAAHCPQYEAHAMCAWEIPVQIRTKAQFIAALQAAVEMQAQRTFEARFFEQLQGEGLDPKASQEFDRLMAMSAKLKEIMSEESVFEMSVKAKGPGVLSSLFGGQVGRDNTTLPGGGVRADDVLQRVLDTE